MADLIAILWADVIALNLLLDLADVMPIDNGMSFFFCLMADVNAISG